MNIHSEAAWKQKLDHHASEARLKLAENDSTDVVVYEADEMSVKLNVVQSGSLRLQLKMGHRTFDTTEEVSAGSMPELMDCYAKTLVMTLEAYFPQSAV